MSAPDRWASFTPSEQDVLLGLLEEPALEEASIANVLWNELWGLHVQRIRTREEIERSLARQFAEAPERMADALGLELYDDPDGRDPDFGPRRDG